MDNNQGVDSFFGKINIPMIITRKVRENVVDRASIFSNTLVTLGFISLIMLIIMVVKDFNYLSSLLGNSFFLIIAAVATGFLCIFNHTFGSSIYYGSSTEFYYHSLISEYKKGGLIKTITDIVHLIGIVIVLFLYIKLYFIG